MFDEFRLECISHKIERFMYINTEQIQIKEYYIMSKGGYIAWIRLDRRLVSEIHRRAALAGSQNFRTATFVPKLARARKIAIDKLLEQGL